MKRCILLVAVCFVGFLSYGQVGIGNTDPKSRLDISATNAASPSSTDGILIPRVDNFPSSDPGADQDGMLVFVTGNGTPAEGFYYWDQGTTSWVSVGGASNDSDWYEAGGSSPANDINDDIYHLGNITVGTNSASPSSPVLVQGDVGSDLANISSTVSGAFASGTYTGLSNSGALSGAGLYTGVANTLGGSNDGTIRGINNSFSNSGTGQKIGLENTFNSADGVRKGFRNYFSTGNSISMGLENQAPGAFSISGILYGLKNDLSSGGNGQRYGVHTVINSTGSGAKYGEFIQINTSAGGQHYGLYSNVQSASGYAGYFIGRTSLGTDPSTGRYLMPAADGTAGQVISTDGSGQLSFVDAATQDIDWYEVGTTTAPNAIGDDMFTQGNVVIGATTNPANVKFYVESNPTSNTVGIRNTMGAATSGLLRGVDNNLTLNGTTNGYAIANNIGGNSTGLSIQAIRNSFSGSGGQKTGMYNSYSFGFGGDARGVYNDFNNSGITNAIGSYNNFANIGSSATAQGTFNSASGSTNAANLYGTRTIFSGSTVSGSAYGQYSLIQTSGTDYGIYAHVDNNAIDYAGYFVGRASFGTDSAVGRYLLPAADGTAGQLMATNGSGQLGFIDAVDTQNSLDGAYDEPGPGGGRIINADVGSVEIVASGSTGIAQVITHNQGGTGLQLNLNGNLNAAGTTTPGLEITNSMNTNGAFTNTYGIYNKMVSNGASVDGTNYGFRNWFQPAGNSAGTLFSFHSDVQNTGNGNHYSYYGRMSSAGTGNKFGLYAEIVPSSGGTHYGVYSEALKTGSYAAYLLGNVSIGTTSSNNYILPPTRGTVNQIMQINGSGSVSWADPSSVFIDTDNQTIDTFGLVGDTLGLSLEDDGQAVQTVDLSNVTFNVSNFALAKMTMSANQSITIAGVTKVNFDTAAIDLGSNFNTSTDRFEVSEAGVYRITASMHSFSASTITSGVELRIYVNGNLAKMDSSNHIGSGIISRNVSAILSLSASQYVEIQVFAVDSFSVNASDTATTFVVERIR